MKRSTAISVTEERNKIQERVIYGKSINAFQTNLDKYLRAKQGKNRQKLIQKCNVSKSYRANVTDINYFFYKQIIFSNRPTVIELCC